jgi:hypothetical protein
MTMLDLRGSSSQLKMGGARDDCEPAALRDDNVCFPQACCASIHLSPLLRLSHNMLVGVVVYSIFLVELRGVVKLLISAGPMTFARPLSERI